MKEREVKATVEIRDFPGLVTFVDPTDTRPGAARVQVNLTSVPIGQLTQRPGLVRVSFESE